MAEASGAGILAALTDIQISLNGIGGALSALPRVAPVPASATAAGTAGSIAIGSDYLYICIGANSWKRVALSAF